MVSLPSNLFTIVGTLAYLLSNSLYYCALATIRPAIVGELLQRQESFFFKKVFVPLFFGFGLVLSFLFFSFPPTPPIFWGRLLGLLLLKGFGCSLFLNGSFFASLVVSRYPLSSLF